METNPNWKSWFKVQETGFLLEKIDICIYKFDNIGILDKKTCYRFDFIEENAILQQNCKYLKITYLRSLKEFLETGSN